MRVVPCPACQAPFSLGADWCPRCGLQLTGPAAVELGTLDQYLNETALRLSQLDTERQRLFAGRSVAVQRRAALIALLRPAPVPRQAVVPQSRARPESSQRSIQNVLLSLGGLLLGIAAVAFTIFAWSRFGIPGRATILGALTLVSFTVPLVLKRFHLPATAETIAAVGIVLLLLDGYAVWRVDLFGLSAISVPRFAGIVGLIVAGLAAGYSFAFSLRLPRLIAIVLVNPALLLLDIEVGPPAWVLTIAIAIDLAVVALARRRSAKPELLTAAILAPLGAMIVLGSALSQLISDRTSVAVGGAVLLVTLAGLGLLAAEIADRRAGRHVAASAAVIAVAVSAFALVPPTYAAAGAIALMSTVVVIMPRQWRIGAMAGAGAVVLAAGVVPTLWTVTTLFGASWATPDSAIALLLLIGAAGVLSTRATGMPGLRSVAVIGLAMSALHIPAATDSPLWIVLTVECVVAISLGVFATRVPPWLCVVPSIVLSVHSGLLSIESRPYTLIVLAALIIGWAAVLVVNTFEGQEPRKCSQRAVGTIAICIALLALTAEACALAATFDISMSLAALGSALVAVGISELMRRFDKYATAAAMTVPVSAVAALGIAVLDWDRATIAVTAAVAAAIVMSTRELRSTGIVLSIGGMLIAGALVFPAVVGAVARPEISGSWLDVTALLVMGVGTWRGGRRVFATTLVPLWTVAVVVVVAGTPWPLGLGVVTAVGMSGALVATMTSTQDTLGRVRSGLGAGFAVAGTSIALYWAISSRPATIAVLAAAVLTSVAITLRASTERLRNTGAVLAGVSVLAEACAVAATFEVEWGFPLLGVSSALVAAAALWRSRSVPLESVAVAGSALAVIVTAKSLWHLALLLTLAGIVVGLVALREDRRPAGWVALGLEITASWIWLGSVGVTVTEAYTVPGAVIASAIGLRFLLRDPTRSSWVTLAPGLSAMLLPALAFALAQPQPLRSLALGTAALGITVAGAVSRRQAPFLLGGITVAIVAARELAPILPWIAATVPAWIPLSVGGAVLVALGATFEQRRRDLRRVHRLVSGMR